MKKTKIIVILLALSLAALAVLRIREVRQQDESPVSRDTRGIAVRTEYPRIGNLKVTRSFTGEVSGSDQAVVYSEAPGRLRSYRVTEGEKVKKDQVIALIDREMTGMDFEQLRVRAPIDGTVTRLYLGRGDTVNQQTPLAVVADLKKIKVSFHIPERDLGLVKRGNTAMLRVDAWPGKNFEGSVERIALSLERSSRSAYAEAVFDNSGRALMPGMFAEVEVVSQIIEDALLLPESAVLRDPSGECLCVFIAADEKAVRKIVETGFSQNDIIQVVSGLEPSDNVIVEGQEFLEDGQAIRIIE